MEERSVCFLLALAKMVCFLLALATPGQNVGLLYVQPLEVGK